MGIVIGYSGVNRYTKVRNIENSGLWGLTTGRVGGILMGENNDGERLGLE